MMSGTVTNRFVGPEGLTYFDATYLAEFGSQSVLHCEDGPALIEYQTSDNRLLSHTYYLHGVLHRLDGPAFERFEPMAEGEDIPDPVYSVHGDTLELAVVQAHAAGVITDDQLSQIKKAASDGEKLAVLATALRSNDG